MRQRIMHIANEELILKVNLSWEKRLRSFIISDCTFWFYSIEFDSRGLRGHTIKRICLNYAKQFNSRWDTRACF